MEQQESLAENRRTGVFVIILVVFGVAIVGAGGFLAWKRQQGGNGTAEASEEFQQWCKIRQEWANQVNPLAGDIMLKSVKTEDEAERKNLEIKRNTLCQDFAKKLRDAKFTDPMIQALEVAMVKEGKVRANIAVEINNALANLPKESTKELNKYRQQLKSYIKDRIKKKKATADQEIEALLSQRKSYVCNGFYRGPITDEGTSGNPYVSWDELEVRRTTALTKFEKRIKELEPLEQFTNRVYHELIRRYRKHLIKCYKWAKKKRPSMSDELGLRLRLNRKGKVIGLAIEWMENRDETILDCIEKIAAKWRLPSPVLNPGEKNMTVVVPLDFKTF